MRPHDLVAAAPHRVDAGRVERAAVPVTRVVAEPFEHPFMGPVGAGDKTVEGHHHLENHFSTGHVGRDPPAWMNSSQPVRTTSDSRRRVARHGKQYSVGPSV